MPTSFCWWHLFIQHAKLHKTTNRTLNKDLIKQLALWLNANKMYLKIAKAEIILLKPKNKQLGTNLILKLCRTWLYTTTHVRYSGILIDDKLNWNTLTSNIVLKLIRSESILSNLRYYPNKEILRTMYFVIFHSYFTDVNMGTNKNSLKVYNCPSEKKHYELWALHHSIFIHHIIFMIMVF